MNNKGDFRSFIVNRTNLKKPASVNMPSFNKNPIDMFSAGVDLTAEFHMDMKETEEKFIFTKLQPFIDSISTIEISKDDLVTAVELIQLKKRSDLNIEYVNAVTIYWELDQAYKRGYDTGYKKSRQDLLNFLKNGEDNE